MSWADHAKTALRAGESVIVTPRGNSMLPLVKSGARVTLEPPDLEALKPGDIVLVRCKGSDYLHLIKARDGQRFQIGNNRGRINGWVGPNAIYGVALHIEN